MKKFTHIFLLLFIAAGMYTCTDEEEISINLDPAEMLLEAGTSAKLNAHVAPADQTSQIAVIWESGDPAVATVGDQAKRTCIVTAVAPGTTEIIATVTKGDKVFSKKCKITVVPSAAKGVTLDKSETEIMIGLTEQLTATVEPATATNKEVTWSSSDDEVATVSETGKVTAVALGTATITVTTKEGGHTAECKVTVIPIAVIGVRLNYTSLNLKITEGEQLTATVEPATATNKEVTWSSNDDKVATVSESGEVQAVGKGSAVITVTTEDGGYTATCEVTVTVPVTGVTLNKTSLNLEVKEQYELMVAVEPATATNKKMRCNSSDGSVATAILVDEDIESILVVVGARIPGTTIITVTTEDGGYKATCDVTVAGPVTGVTLDKTSLNLPIGKSHNLTATVRPENAINKEVTWSSSDDKVATVSESGEVQAVGKGTAKITVTTKEGGHTATCEVTVTIPVTGVTLDKTSLILEIGVRNYGLTEFVDIEPSNATNKEVTWSSSDAKVATVSESGGYVRAVGLGTAKITVTTKDGGYTATCEVTVTQPVTGVTLDKTSLNLSLGKTHNLTATVEPATATNKKVTWSSSDDKVATVSETGKVTAVGQGTTTITVTTEDGKKTATCTVTVTQPQVLTIISITPDPFYTGTGGELTINGARFLSSGNKVTIVDKLSQESTTLDLTGFIKSQSTTQIVLDLPQLIISPLDDPYTVIVKAGDDTAEYNIKVLYEPPYVPPTVP